MVSRFDVFDVGQFIWIIALAETGGVGKAQEELAGLGFFNRDGQRAAGMLFTGQDLEAYPLLGEQGDAVTDEGGPKIEFAQQVVAVALNDAAGLQAGQERDSVFDAVQQPAPEIIAGKGNNQRVLRVVDLDKVFEIHARIVLHHPATGHGVVAGRVNILPMQLERILQKHGFGTRKGCRALVRHERVAVNGEICDNPFVDVPTEGLVLTVDGVDWPYLEQATIILNKPAGYECSRKPQHHLGVLELIPPQLRERGVQPIGRLDEDTTGLLVITDDGQLNHVLSSGKRKVPKVYLATTRHPLDQAQIDQLLAGVLLHDELEPIAAAAAEIAAPNQLRLTLTEGKYHQVKRMLAAVGNRVDALHRVSIGGLSLPDDLKPGEWRWLTPADLAELQRTA